MRLSSKSSPGWARAIFVRHCFVVKDGVMLSPDNFSFIVQVRIEPETDNLLQANRSVRLTAEHWLVS